MTRQHQVYFLQRADGLIKIGTSADFPGRLNDLTRSHGMLGVIRLINGDRQRERQIHSKFKRFHEYGEWFRSEHGALIEEIMMLPDGDAVPETKTDARKLWSLEDGRLARETADTFESMLEVRRQRTGLKSDAAIKALSVEYGLPVSFITHLRKRAATVSAYGMVAVREAYRAELAAALSYYNAEVDKLASDSIDDAELLEIETRISSIREQLAAKKAGLRLARSRVAGDDK